MSSPTRSINKQPRNNTTPRMTRRGDMLASSIEFTPAKDVSARLSSFKRLSASGTRCVKSSDVSSVLAQSRTSNPDFKVFVDIPFDGVDSSSRGKSPSTPKRLRADFRDTFEDISPIGFAPVDFGSPRTTPKRRKSLDRRASSLTDLFSALREEDESSKRRGISVSQSVDLSAKSASRYFTPPRKEARIVVTPNAPKKSSRRKKNVSILSSDEEEVLPRRLFEESPNPIATPSRLLESSVDYSGVMSIVGFVASYISRTECSVVPISSLVALISSVSVHHGTCESATRVVRALIAIVPEWVTLLADQETVKFNREMKTFDVLTKLRILKRAQNQIETRESQDKWF